MPCKIMDAVTYPDTSVQQELAGHWLEVKYDGPDAEDAATLFQVAAVPTAIAVAADGTIRGRVEGFLEPAALRAELVAFRGAR